MAKQLTTITYDDLTGEEIRGEAHTRKFAIDGIEYHLDLTKKNAQAFDKQMGEWVDKAARIGRIKRASKKTGGQHLQNIRDWAKANGYTLSSRGRIPQDIIDAYHAPVEVREAG